MQRPRGLDLKTRLMRFVSPEPNTGCWLWVGHINRTGYGHMRVMGKTVMAHRLSYALLVKEPKKLHVLHKCDTPCCVNPDHLFLGTNQDNVNDKMSKGRHRGKPQVLTPDQKVVVKNLLLTKSSYKIAPLFGVSSATIRRIRNWSP